MYSKIAQELDKIADVLESKGLSREALELDVVANTMEKLSYMVKQDPLFKGDWTNLKKNLEKNIMLSKQNQPIDNRASVNFLDNIIKKRFDAFVKNYGKDVPQVEQLKAGAEGVLEMLKAEKAELLPQIKKQSEQIEKYWEYVAPLVHSAEIKSRTQQS
jgi:hypothetical protein